MSTNAYRLYNFRFAGPAFCVGYSFKHVIEKIQWKISKCSYVHMHCTYNVYDICHSYPLIIVSIYKSYTPNGEKHIYS